VIFFSSSLLLKHLSWASFSFLQITTVDDEMKICEKVFFDISFETLGARGKEMGELFWNA
jgi:hypothetical protein